AAHAGMLSPGASMPHFELRDQEGRMVSSNDLAGKRYLLWFYPKAMTPGCTIEAKSLRDNYSTLEKAGVVVLGVSFDEPASNKQFVAAESTDAKTARRISYLVGADGKIEKAYDNVDPNVHAGQVVSDCSANGK